MPVVVGAGAPAYTPSNTTSITASSAPGTVLHAKVSAGKTWEREGRRGGKLTFSETITEYLDQNEELVITARSVGVRTERVVEQQ